MAGSSAQLRRLGAELRRLRLTTGRTQDEVGRAIGRTHASLANWERGKTRLSKSDLVCLLTELRAPIDVRKELERLRDEAGQGGGQWVVYGLPDWLRPLMSFEEDAVAIEAFEPILVPGLLQTEEYATAVHQANPYIAAPRDVARWVSARMRRQLRLTGSDPLKLHAVISEAALRMRVGGPRVMADQVARLIEAAGSETITIQVLPFEAGIHPIHNSNLEVLRFADPKTDAPLGYFDGPLGGYLVSDEGDVATMIRMFEDVCRVALPVSESIELLTAILDAYREKEASNA